jgi:flagellin-like protein
MNCLSDKRAFSPVVASIILIAATVAISIAVAGWITGFTFSFAKVEDLRVINDQWGPDCAYVDLTLRNGGTSNIVVSGLKVNSQVKDFEIISGSVSIEPGEINVVRVTSNFAPGASYSFAFSTSSGYSFVYYSVGNLP